MSILDLMLKAKSKYILTYINGFKLVVDTNKMSYDEYKWYKQVGTLEQELTTDKLKELIKECSIKRIG